MPHTTSAKKALRQDAKRKERNKVAKKALKVQVKKYLSALKDGTLEQQQAELAACAKRLDKLAAKRVIHPNMAARNKSKLAIKLNVAKAAPQE